MHVEMQCMHSKTTSPNLTVGHAEKTYLTLFNPNREEQESMKKAVQNIGRKRITEAGQPVDCEILPRLDI